MLVAAGMEGLVGPKNRAGRSLRRGHRAGARHLQMRHRAVVGSFGQRHVGEERSAAGGQAQGPRADSHRPVETPLEFENLQAADLTSWKAAAEHPEFEAVLDRIQALSPIPDERLARSAVEDARREFRGRTQAGGAREPGAVPSVHAARHSRARRTARRRPNASSGSVPRRVRREAEAAQRQQRAIVAEKAEIEGLLVRLDLDAAERALAIADETFERPAELRPAARAVGRASGPGTT